MSVVYNVVFKNGIPLRRSDICFGKLNRLPFQYRQEVPSTQTRFTSDQLNSYYENINSDKFSVASAMHSIQFLVEPRMQMSYWTDPDLRPVMQDVSWGQSPSQSSKKQALKNINTIYKELLADMPVFQDMISIHPIAKRVDARLAGQPADKVMLGIFAFRNLANYDFSRLYLLMREKGYKPRYCLVMSMLFELIYNRDQPYRKATLRSGGENSMFNPATFGRQAMLNWMNQDTNWNPWFQESFADQGGYERDSHLIERANEGDETCIFDPRGEGAYSEDFDPEWSDEGDEHADIYFRHMVDAFSIPEDEPLPHCYFCDDSFYITMEGNQSVMITDLLANMDSFLRANGVEPLNQ